MATNFNSNQNMNMNMNPMMQMPMQMQSPYPAQQYFPQPQGNVYMLNNSNEVGNIPVSNGVSAGICLSEGTMFLKTLQNGAPVMLSYRLSSLESPNNNTQMNAPMNEQGAPTDILAAYDERLSKIERLLTNNSKGGKLEWPL